MNAFFLKELRQLTRSRFVAGGLCLLLFAQLFVAASVVSGSQLPDGSLPDNLGAHVQSALLGVLGLALCVGLPVAFFARLVAEAPKGLLSLPLATAAPPRAVVDGKLAAGLAYAAALAAGSLPFQLLCVALRGVDPLVVLSGIGALFLACALQLHLAVAIAAGRTSGAGGRWAVFVLLELFGVLSIAGHAVAAIAVRSIYGGPGAPASAAPAPALGSALAALALTATFCLLLRAHAARAIAAPTTDRDRVPRLTYLALWAAWFVAAAVFAAVEHDPTAILAWAGVSAAVLLFLFLPATGSPPGLSRRVLAEKPEGRRRLLRRLPFAAGFPGGLVFALLVLGATAVPAAIAAAAMPATSITTANDRFLGAFRVLALILYLLGLPMLLRGWRLARSPARLPGVPILTLSVLFLLQVVPPFIVGFAGSPLGFPFFLGGVLGGEGGIVGMHCVFAAIAFICGLASVSNELHTALHAWLLPASSGRATSDERRVTNDERRVTSEPPSTSSTSSTPSTPSTPSTLSTVNFPL